MTFASFLQTSEFWQSQVVCHFTACWSSLKNKQPQNLLTILSKKRKVAFPLIHLTIHSSLSYFLTSPFSCFTQLPHVTWWSKHCDIKKHSAQSDTLYPKLWLIPCQSLYPVVTTSKGAGSLTKRVHCPQQQHWQDVMSIQLAIKTFLATVIIFIYETPAIKVTGTDLNKFNTRLAVKRAK